MRYLFTWLLISTAFLSTGENFYYYKNSKTELQLSTKYLYVLCNISSKEILQKQIQNIGSLVYFSADKYPNRLVKTYQNVPEIMLNTGNYYAQIKLNDTTLDEQGLQLVTQELKNISSILHVANCYSIDQTEPFATTYCVWVQLKDEKGIIDLQSEVDRYNYFILGQNPYMLNWVMIGANTNAIYNSLQISQILHETKLFESVEPEMRGIMKSTCVNDTYFSAQWGLSNTGQYSGVAGIDSRVCLARNMTTGSPNVDIAVIDHGFENNHPDLIGNLENNGYDAELGTTPTGIYGSHGTSCAGIVAATGNNSEGIVGVASGCQLMSISEQVLTSSQAEAADGFNWARLNGAEIISNSWFVNPPSIILDISILTAISSGRGGLGCVVVFASGNNNGAILYPANSNPNIIAVGAISPCGERKNPSSCDGEGWGSNFGNELDVVAPGVFIATTDRQGNNGYNMNTSPSQFLNRDYTAWFNGTSSACPHVAGVAALILSVNPCLTAIQVQEIIQRTAQKVGGYNYNVNTSNGTWNNEMGYGLVDAQAAVIMAQSKYLQNLTNTGSALYRSPMIFAGYNVNPLLTNGNYITTGAANVTIQAQQSIDFQPGCDLQGIVNAQITSVGSCNNW